MPGTTDSHATDAIPQLAEAGAVAIELMDASSLRVARKNSAAGDLLHGLSLKRQTALLIELDPKETPMPLI